MMIKSVVQSIQQFIEPLHNRFHLAIEKKIVDSRGKIRMESTDYYYTGYNKSGKLETQHKPTSKVDIKS